MKEKCVVQTELARKYRVTISAFTGSTEVQPWHALSCDHFAAQFMPDLNQIMACMMAVSRGILQSTWSHQQISERIDLKNSDNIMALMSWNSPSL